jgi:hypothetical protein
MTLLEERKPYLISTSRQPPNYRDSDEYPRDVEQAKNKLTALAGFLGTILRRIHKIASQTFHVLLWYLIPGTRTQNLHIFTGSEKQETRQHLIRAMEADDMTRVRHHTAKDT